MRLSQKILFATFILYCLHGITYAQQAFDIKGVVFRKGSPEKVAQALITNLKSHVVMMSDELGVFSIKVSQGDTLLITKVEYTSQKIVVNNSYELAINMQPIIQLNEVVIKGQTKKQELNEIVNAYRSKGLYFDGKPPAKIFSPFGGSPITGLYELFSKDAANERRFIRFSKSEQESVAVDRRYTKELVKRVTKLPDDDVVKFMVMFTPSYEDMKEWNDYQLITYINHSLEYYQKNKDKPESKPQKLY